MGFTDFLKGAAKYDPQLAPILLGDPFETKDPEASMLGQRVKNASSHQSGIPIPYFAGKTKFALKWISDIYDIESEAVFTKVGKDKSQTGTVFTVGFAADGPHGPLDKIFEIRFGDETVWTGEVTRGVSDDYADITIEGRGTVRFYWGTDTQTADATLVAGSGINHSGYRGRFYGVFNVSLLANASEVPNIVIIAARYPSPSFMTAASNISDDANLAACIYEWLANTRYGLGLSDDKINLTALDALANTLATEDFGVTVWIDRKQEYKEIQNQAMEYINGFTVAQADGKIAYDIIRPSDASYDEITTINPEHLTDRPKDRSIGWRQTKNTIFLKFTDRALDYEDNQSEWVDLGNIQMVGEPFDKKLTREWVTRMFLANRLASRFGRHAALPSRAGLIDVRKSIASGLNPGSLFLFNYPDLGISNLLCRVTKIKVQSPKIPKVGIEWEEDRSYLNDFFYEPEIDTPIAPELLTPQPLEYQMGLQAPRGIEAGIYTAADLADVVFFAVRADKVSTGYNMYWEKSAGSYKLVGKQSTFDGFAMRGHLGTAYSAATDLVDETVLMDIIIDSLDDVITDLDREDALLRTWLVFVNNEIFSIFDPSLTSAKRYSVSTIRNRYDTRRSDHALNDVVWIVQQNLLGIVDPNGWGNVTFKLQPFIGSSTVDLTSVTGLTVAYDARVYKPGAPVNLKANGDGANPVYSTGDNVEITWKNGTTARIGNDDFAPTGETYTYVDLEFYTTGDVFQSTLQVSGASPYTLTNANIISIMGSEINFKIRAYAVRSGRRSFTYDDITVYFL